MKCLLFLLLALWAAAVVAAPDSASAEGSIADKSLKSLVLPANLIHVPLLRQATDYTCGVTALQSVLAYYGDEFREDELARQLHSNSKDGTNMEEISSFARKKGYTVNSRTGMSVATLKQMIDQRLPTILLIQAWPDRKVNFKTDWDDGHYVVAVGYDRSNIYFMDPSSLGNYAFIPIADLTERWHDINGKDKLEHFGMTVSKMRGPQYKPEAVKRLE